MKFGELIDSDKPCLIMFFTSLNKYALECYGIMKTIADEFIDDLKVIKIDVDKNIELSEALRVKTLPTFIIYDKGEMKHRVQGLKTYKELKNLIKSI